MIGSNVTLASASNLLSGVTAYGKNGVKYTGTNKGYDAGVTAGKSAISIIKVSQSYFTDPNSWANTGNSWGSGTAERLMTKTYSYPAGFSKYTAVIAASGDSYNRIRYITISGSTSTTMVGYKANTDARGGYNQSAGAFIEGNVSANGGSLTVNVSISRYSDNDLAVGIIIFH